MNPPAQPVATCPDSEVYERLNSVERRLSADRVRWEQQERTNEDVRGDLNRATDGMNRLATTIKVATAIVGFIIALAGVIIPLWKG